MRGLPSISILLLCSSAIAIENASSDPGSLISDEKDLRILGFVTLNPSESDSENNKEAVFEAEPGIENADEGSEEQAVGIINLSEGQLSQTASALDKEATTELTPADANLSTTNSGAGSPDENSTPASVQEKSNEEATNDFAENLGVIVDINENDLDNATVAAGTGVHHSYAEPNYQHEYGSHGHGHTHAHNNHGYRKHVQPLKQSVVHRDPYDHYDEYDATRTQDHDRNLHSHRNTHQTSYGHHSHGYGHGHQSSRAQHHGSGHGSNNFRPYHYDTHHVPKCAIHSRLYHNITFCLEDEYYPTETIAWAIRQSGHYAYRLLSDITYQSADNLVDGLTRAEEEKMTYSHYYGPHTTHQQQVVLDKFKPPFTGYSYNQDYYKDGGYLCPSSIYYSRPKRAMNTYGEWKVIVNLEHLPTTTHYSIPQSSHGGHGHHHHRQAYTQTLRLEQCIYPNSPCSYVDSHYHSRCLQKHNFVRLLAWTYADGLHIDNFKMPIACSCHIQQPVHYYTPHIHHNHHHQQHQSHDHGIAGHAQNHLTKHGKIISGIHQGKQNILNTILG